MRPAIGTSVRVLCGMLAVACLGLAGVAVFEDAGWPALIPLAFAAIFAGPAVLATGPSPGSDAAVWARRRYSAVRRAQMLAVLVGFAGVGVVYVIDRGAARGPWPAAIQLVSACLLGLSTVLELPVAYYRHYVSETETAVEIRQESYGLPVQIRSEWVASDMEFSGKLTPEDWSDVAVVTRPKLYWLRLLLANWYGAAILAVFVWATISGLSGRTAPYWPAMAVIWTVIAFVWISVKRNRSLELARMNDQRPDRIRFIGEGVAWDGQDGATGLVPWRDLRVWHEGRRVAVLETHGRPAIIVSIAQLSEAERERVRQYLRASVATFRR